MSTVPDQPWSIGLPLVIPMSWEQCCPEVPDNPEAKIWRYLDLPKFVRLLQQKSLYFSRADRLGDPFEGSFSTGALEALKQRVSEEYVEKIRPFITRLRKWTYISCWHLSEFESEALWRLYGGSAAVALQTTFAKLQEAVPFQIDKEAGDIVIKAVSQVHYIDYRTQHPELANTLGPFLCKRGSFAHEREIRAIVQRIQRNSSRIAPESAETSAGIMLPVDLSYFSERVYVSPLGSEWLLDTICDLCNKYNLKVRCEQSSLLEDPFF